jgi:hypothetical protein
VLLEWSENFLRDWREKNELMLQSNGRLRAFYGLKAKYPEMEDQLC